MSGVFSSELTVYILYFWNRAVTTQMQSFLIAFTVSIGLGSVRPNNEEGMDSSAIQENFHNFFDSIRENNLQKTETYRKFLVQDAAREKQAFDLKKEELQFTQGRNAYKQRNLHDKSGDLKEKVALKREINEIEIETEPALTHPVDLLKSQLEKDFIAHMDKGKRTQETIISKWTEEEKRALCLNVLGDPTQFSFGFTPFITTNSVIFNYCTQHEPVRLELLQCPVDGTFIYESRRQTGCFIVMTQKKFKNVRPIGYVYIQYEKCGLNVTTSP